MSSSEHQTGRQLKRGQVLALAGVGTIAAAIVSSPLSAQTTLDKISIAGPATEDATGMYYGVKTGIFQRVGLDVEMVATTSGTAAVAAMVSGTYDMARPSMLSMVVAHARGIGVTLVCPANGHDSKQPLALLQVATDSAIRTAADLNGKIIGTPALNDINSISIRAWSDKNGGDSRTLKFIEIPNALLESALVQHRIDAAVLQSPFLFSSLDAKTTKTLGDSWSAIAPRFTVGVSVARSDWATTHRDALQRFTNAYKTATTYVNTHPAETVQYVVDLTKMEAATIRSMHRANVPTELKIAEIQPVIDAAAKYGVIPERFPARDMLLMG